MSQQCTWLCHYTCPLGISKGLFTWSGGPRSSGVGFFCFVSPRAWKQNPTRPGPPTPCKQALILLQHDVPCLPELAKRMIFFCLSTGWPRFTCTAVSAYVTPQTLGYSTLHLRSSVDMWSEHASIDSDWPVIIFLPVTQFDAFTAGVIVQYQSLQMC